MTRDPAEEREVIALYEALLDLPESDREAALAARTEGRASLERRVRDLIRAERSGSLHTGAALDAVEEPDPPERLGAYRLGERLGKGGMGSVYRGERITGDFDHAVAIKIIKPGLMSRALVERFRGERRVLAGLSHPHIARLFDGGETAEGAPWIVMELIDGRPLTVWLDEARPDRAARLALFLEVCEAVGFAHRNLIVHRDLTPSNVLVTADGHAKLIDFGIAKPADGSGASAAPLTGDHADTARLSLTPGFAAPERLTSAGATTAADIYGLGRLLETLAPHAAGEAELRAIVARATAAAPEDRYPTAEALADDVRALIGGRPVAAVGGGRRYRFGKFVGRNRLPVAGAASLAGVVLVALVAVSLANVRERAARAEADQRFEQTRAIARTMLFDAYDEVSRSPGSTRARAMLADSGLRYLDALAADPAAPLDVKLEAARGYVRLSQVTGGGEQSQLGKLAEGGELLKRAEAILAPLHAARPADRAVSRALAEVRIEQAAQNLYNSNATGPARAQAVEAAALVRPFATADAEAARFYATALQGQGDSYGWDDDWAQALPPHQAAERFIAGLPPAIREDRKVRMARSANLRLLGEAFHKTDQVEAARNTLDQAVEINRRLLADFPGDPAMMRKLATSLWYRAVVHRTNKRAALAEASIAEAAGLAAQLRDRDPADAGGVQLYAIIGEVEAQILTDNGRAAEGERVGEAVLAAHRRLVALAGNAPGALRSMAAAMNTNAGNFHNAGRYDRACARWRETLAVYEELERRGELSDTDRNGGLADVRGYLAQGCDPPRAIADEI